MLAEWIRDELIGMTMDFDKEDIYWLRDLPSEDLELALGDYATGPFWDELRVSVKELATELLFERDNA